MKNKMAAAAAASVKEQSFNAAASVYLEAEEENKRQYGGSYCLHRMATEGDLDAKAVRKNIAVLENKLNTMKKSYSIKEEKSS